MITEHKSKIGIYLDKGEGRYPKVFIEPFEEELDEFEKKNYDFHYLDAKRRSSHGSNQKAGYNWGIFKI